MITFIASLVFAVAFLVLLVITVMIKPENASERGDRAVTAGAATGCLCIALVLFFLSSLVEVSTKNVGVETSFGHPTAELGNGLHFKAPWAHVTELPAAINTDVYTQAAQPNTYPCIPIHIAYQIIACADVSIQWRIEASAAKYLFTNYQDFTNIQLYMNRELSRTLNDDLSDYDPLTLTAQGQVEGPSLSQLSTQVTDDMKAEVDQHITVNDVYITVLNYDPSVQSYINTIQQQYSNTRKAQQQILTNKAQAEANEIIAASVNNNPGVLTSQCLNMVQALGNANYTGFPAAFNCFGSPSTIVVPSK